MNGRTVADSNCVGDTFRIRASGRVDRCAQCAAKEVVAGLRLNGDELTGVRRLEGGLQAIRVDRLAPTGDITRLL